MTTEHTPPPSPSFGSRVGSGLRWLIGFFLRLLVVIVIAVLIGVGIYYGIPRLYNQFVSSFEQRIARVENAQTGLQQVDDQISQRVNSLQSRLDSLELQQDSGKQQFSEVQTALDQTTQNRQELEDTLASIQATAGAQNDELSDSLAEMSGALSNLEMQLAALEDRVIAGETAIAETGQSVVSLDDLLRSEEAPLAAIRRELHLVKAMEMITRSRLLLAENNTGLALEDIQAARDLLASLQETTPEYQLTALNEIIQRLDRVLERLPNSAVVAANDLENAWQLLRIGLPLEPDAEQPEAIVTPGQIPTSMPVATPTP